MDEMFPIGGVMDQSAEGSIARNCWLWEEPRLTAAGVPDAKAGKRVRVAEALAFGSERLVAVTIRGCAEVMVSGAVYRPVADKVPIEGVTDHNTSVLPEWLTVARNCKV